MRVKKMKREEEEEEDPTGAISKIDVGTPFRSRTKPPRFLKTPVIAETWTMTMRTIRVSTLKKCEARRYFQDKYDSESLANKYMRMIVSSERDRLMDYTYGVRHENGKWMIGDSAFEIETDDTILISGKR